MLVGKELLERPTVGRAGQRVAPRVDLLCGERRDRGLAEAMGEGERGEDRAHHGDREVRALRRDEQERREHGDRDHRVSDVDTASAPPDHSEGLDSALEDGQRPTDRVDRNCGGHRAGGHQDRLTATAPRRKTDEPCGNALQRSDAALGSSAPPCLFAVSDLGRETGRCAEYRPTEQADDDDDGRRRRVPAARAELDENALRQSARHEQAQEWDEREPDVDAFTRYPSRKQHEREQREPQRHVGASRLVRHPACCPTGHALTT